MLSPACPFCVGKGTTDASLRVGDGTRQSFPLEAQERGSGNKYDTLSVDTGDQRSILKSTAA